MTEDNVIPEKLVPARLSYTLFPPDSSWPNRSFLINSSIPSQASLPSLSTTAVSSVNIQTLAFPDGSRGTFSTDPKSPSSSTYGISDVQNTPKIKPKFINDGDDDFSVASQRSFPRSSGDLMSLLDERIQYQSLAWTSLSAQRKNVVPFGTIEALKIQLPDFEKEFDEIDSINSERGNEEEVIIQWKAKYKHYLILSSAGKPIYSRHGDQNLINSYIGVIQTIISFYKSSNDSLLGFYADGTRFVISTYGPLYLVAISRLGESDSQLRAQLEALYMQILSTLTLPTLQNFFTSRPNIDLRRPLEGTESLLSSLADTFTKGSPSALLSSLECLALQKSKRQLINNSLLKNRPEKLLYGLVVAGGKLVSVIRPKRHSLHPSDIQLIFNMLFEADGIRAGGGENWIPICLPGFNNRGYLYMYVSFLGASEEYINQSTREIEGRHRNEQTTFVLISADKESFFDIKKMRDDIVAELELNGGLEIIREAVCKGRPSLSEIAHGTYLSHFLYKSRTNVQFIMPEYTANFSNLIARRRLMTLYHSLHASIHAKHSHLKMLQCAETDITSLACCTPIFEFYCIAGPNLSRAELTKEANKVVQWIRSEAERLFIIGGAVF
ncbi:Vacuolar fusion protein MON1 [Erysiphe neolycopersici]|uniref:Vacuolar fusion protein MON1 n=1 Tax=Erysiphe neolycopersici TaxID=212602 RepID=A0A420HIV3_9PEZI|nr:Vacuolar fusion protein MON1 [Erysiphe neolycopersici]